MSDQSDQLHTALLLLKAVDRGNGQYQTAEWQASFRAWSDRNFPADPEVNVWQQSGV